MMQDSTAPDRPFRPRSTRIVALTLAVLVPVVLTAVGVVARAGVLDLVGFVVVGLLIAWVLWRMASVRATPGHEGLVVRNVFITTRLVWPQIVSVRFGDRPWPQLDLTDGDTLAVMGIQRSDGALAMREARRLAALIEEHDDEVPDN